MIGLDWSRYGGVVKKILATITRGADRKYIFRVVGGVGIVKIMKMQFYAKSRVCLYSPSEESGGNTA